MATCVIWSSNQSSVPLRRTLEQYVEYMIVKKQADRFLVCNDGLFDAMTHFVLVNLSEKYPWIKYSVVLTSFPVTSLPDEDMQDILVPDCVISANDKEKEELRNRWIISQADLVLLYGPLTTGIPDHISVVRMEDNLNGIF